MEFNFWTILFLILGLYLFLVAIRFTLGIVSGLIGYFTVGFVGVLIGGLLSWLTQYLLFPEYAWYHFVILGSILGWCVWLIIKIGMKGLFISLGYLLWYSLKSAFLIRFDDIGSNNIPEKGPTYKHITVNTSRLCASCKHYDGNRFFCDYHKVYKGSTEKICDDWKYPGTY